MNQEQDEYKKPEFIYVGEEYEEDVGGAYEEQRLFTALQDLHGTSYPVSLRVIAFFVFVFSAFIAVIAAFAAAFWFVGDAATLFKVPQFHSTFKKTFNLMKKMLFITLGSGVAIFAPAMGMGIVIMYFLMSGESMNSVILERMTRSGTSRNN